MDKLTSTTSLVPQRDQTLDTVKGIGIILMVLAHSGIPNAVCRYIYLFHMALFFMASGYIWNDKKVADFAAIKKSLLARIKGIMLPFFVANGIFTILNNIFVQWGIYGPEKTLTLRQIAINFFKNMLLAGDTTMGGASWFLRTLFFISVAHIFVRYIATHWKFGKVFFISVTVITFAGTVVINRTRMTFPMGIHTCFCGYAALLLGYGIRNFNLSKWIEKVPIVTIFISFSVLLGLSFFGSIGLGAGNIENLPFFIIASLSGWALCWSISKYVSGPLQAFLCYCGKKSVWIVFGHFIAFKPVALLYLLITENSISLLSSFPVVVVPWLWFAYTVFGVLLPLLLCMIFSALRSTILLHNSSSHR